MVGRSAGDGVDAHADKPPEQHVAGESRRTRGGNFLGQLHDLRLITTLLDGDRR